ncbi:type IV toxin-antitoxin system AbiEi family antitoxin domain-containing protein [Kribbella sp. NPDC055071]
MNPRLEAVAAKHGGVFSRQQALRAGYTPDQIEDRLRDSRWERVRHGQYVERTDLDHLPPWERELLLHRRLVYAAVNAMRPGTAIVSHHSALVVHGVPVWGVDLTEVQLTRSDSARTGSAARVRHHHGQLTGDAVIEVDNLRVTSVARSLVETAAAGSFESAVVSADAVLRNRMVPDAELRGAVEQTEFWRGGPTVRAAVGFASPLAESVAESRLRVLMHQQGLPGPELQAVFHDADGFIGRVDFYFPEHRTIVEFDGMSKYADGSSVVLIQEKIREDRLRALGLQVVRLTWEDLAHPDRTAMLIRRVFARSRETYRAG